MKACRALLPARARWPGLRDRKPVAGCCRTWLCSAREKSLVRLHLCCSLALRRVLCSTWGPFSSPFGYKAWKLTCPLVICSLTHGRWLPPPRGLADCFPSSQKLREFVLFVTDTWQPVSCSQLEDSGGSPKIQLRTLGGSSSNQGESVLFRAHPDW